MVRVYAPVFRLIFSFPHSRGDGPVDTGIPALEQVFSPLAWGWSAIVPHCQICHDVFPTRVGMVRHHEIKSQPAKSFPHSRGDGPNPPAWNPHRKAFSPLAWGWSIFKILVHHPLQVFPTRVGMVRRRSKLSRRLSSFPHSRGDGPLGNDKVSGQPPLRSFSPLAWGWSDKTFVVTKQNGVFPTRVGMVRRIGSSR